MAKSFVLTLVVVLGGIFLIGSCDNLFDDFDEGHTFPEERDTRFVQCYYEEDLAKNNCDSVLTSIFDKSLFKKNIHFDLAESTMNCEVDGDLKLVAFGDSNQCVPNSYDLRFMIKENGKDIFPFRMVAGNDMEFEPVSTIIADQLLGYRQLLEGKFQIDYSEAKSIALENGVDFNESNLELVKNEGDSSAVKSTYHWEAELEYDHNSVVLLLIDVQSGKTSKEVFTMESIE